MTAAGKQALILFVRRPERGKVKTRIAATAGNDAALAVYKSLLQHTQQCTYKLACTKHVFYADAIAIGDLWQEGYSKHMQLNDTNLGTRMSAAFNVLFNKGYGQVCIIGSDCADLTQKHIEAAFDALAEYDVVLGPATDGGYYLLAMREKTQPLFEDIAWSTSAVLQHTIALIKASSLSYKLLETLSDVDTWSDVPTHWKEALQPPTGS